MYAHVLAQFNYFKSRLTRHSWRHTMLPELSGKRHTSTRTCTRTGLCKCTVYVEDNLSTTIATALADSQSCLCVYVTAMLCLLLSTYLGTSLEVEGEHVLAGARLALTHQEDAVPAAELLLH